MKKKLPMEPEMEVKFVNKIQHECKKYPSCVKKKKKCFVDACKIKCFLCLNVLRVGASILLQECND